MGLGSMAPPVTVTLTAREHGSGYTPPLALLAAVRTGRGALGRLVCGRQVLVVVRVLLVLVAVVLAWELNRADVTATRPHPWDIHPAVPQLVSEGTDRIVPGINGLTGRQQGEDACRRDDAAIGAV